MGEILRRVVMVAGSQITVNPEADSVEEGSARIGVVVKVGNANHDVVATISAVRCENNSPSKRTLFADLLGEIVASDEGPSRFKRGVPQSPRAGARGVIATYAHRTA